MMFYIGVVNSMFNKVSQVHRRFMDKVTWISVEYKVKHRKRFVPQQGFYGTEALST